MRSVYIEFIICYIIITFWIEKSCETRTEFEFPSYANEFKGIEDDRNYGDKVCYNHQSSSSLPITFEAPVELIMNSWNSTPRLPRLDFSPRTFLDGSEYINNEETKSFPTFHGLINFIRPLYENISNLKSIRSRSSSNQTISEPYKYEYPFDLHITTEKNFLLPPKPIRASIIKLETVTRYPHFYEPLDYISTPKYYQLFSKFKKNDTEKQNTLHIDELGFHSISAINFPTEPSLSFKKVYKNKKFSEPKWSYNLHISDLNDAVTDKINTLISKIGNAVKENNAEKNVLNGSNITEIFFGTKKKKQFPTTNNVDSEDNIAFLVTESINVNHKYNIGLQNSTDNRKIKLVNTKRLEEVTTESISEKYTNNSSGIINIEQIRVHNYGINDNNAANTKIFESPRSFTNDSSIKIITDLTLTGLSKSKEQTANIPIYTKYRNMSNLIRHELNKLKDKNLLKSRLDKFTEKAKDSFFTSANKISKITEGDDSNLDLKILRDTNWNGFRIQLPEIFTATRNIPKTKQNIKGKTPIEIFKPVTSLMWKNSLKNSKNSNNKSVVVEIRVSKPVTKATQFSHNVRFKNLLLDNIEGIKDLFRLKNEKKDKQNFEKMEDLKFTDKLTKKGIVMGINNKNETLKYNSSKHINENSKLLSNRKKNNFLNSTLTENLDIYKKSSQNNSKESNRSDNIKNRNRRGRLFRQKLKTKTQRIHENIFDGSLSINNSFANREILKKNLKALPNNFNNTKNYSRKDGNYNITSENTNSKIISQHKNNEHSDNRKPKSRKKLRRKQPAKTRTAYSHPDYKSLT